MLRLDEGIVGLDEVIVGFAETVVASIDFASVSRERTLASAARDVACLLHVIPITHRVDALAEVVVDFAGRVNGLDRLERLLQRRLGCGLVERADI